MYPRPSLLSAPHTVAPPPPPPPPPPPTPPNWDFATDSPISIPGGGTVTVHWGIILISFEVGPCVASPAWSGQVVVTVGPGGHAEGFIFGNVTDTGNGGSADGVLFWTVDG